MTPETKLTPRQKIAQGIAAWDRNDYLSALEVFNEVIRDHPNFPDVHNRAGLCKAMLGNLEGALMEFERALELAPTYAEAHFNRGIVLNELGRHDEAETAFLEAQQLDTRDGVAFPSHVGNQIANAHAKLGELYTMADRPEEAIEQYRSALGVRPRYLDVRERLAEAMLQAGQAEEAKKELMSVLATDPGYTEARLRLGVALHRLGDRDGAVREWERVAQERPDDRRARAYLASVSAREEP